MRPKWYADVKVPRRENILKIYYKIILCYWLMEMEKIITKAIFRGKIRKKKNKRWRHKKNQRVRDICIKKRKHKVNFNSRDTFFKSQKTIIISLYGCYLRKYKLSWLNFGNTYLNFVKALKGQDQSHFHFIPFSERK